MVVGSLVFFAIFAAGVVVDFVVFSYSFEEFLELGFVQVLAF